MRPKTSGGDWERGFCKKGRESSWTRKGALSLMAPANDAHSPTEAKPLSGRRVVITRAREQAQAFARPLETLGAAVIEFPTIEIVDPESFDPLDQAIARIASYHWIIFTSVNGVRQFLSRLRFLQRDSGELSGLKIAAIGPETARALESRGLRPWLVPDVYQAEAILEQLAPDDVRGKRVLLPRAAQARDVLPGTLRDWGAEVDVVEAYRTVAARSDVSWLGGLLQRKEIDMVTFTSSSTAVNFAALFSGANIQPLLAGTAVACIGPITAHTVEELGLHVDVIASEYTVEGLAQAIVDYFSRQR